MPVRQVEAIAGQPTVAITPPGSKSLSCRAIMLASVSSGPSCLRGLLVSDDTTALLAAVEAMGVQVHVDGASVTLQPPTVLGRSGHVRVDLGHGGTPARFMLAMASLGCGEVVVDGSPRLRERPMGDGLGLLEQVGVAAHALDQQDRLPIEVVGGPWTRRDVRVSRTASSQFLSAMLLVAPAAADGIDLHLAHAAVSEAYLRLTIAELRAWGIPVSVHESDGRVSAVHVDHGRPAGQDRTIPADASSALFWALAAAILPGASMTLEGVQLDDGQPDAAGIRVLAQMGLSLESTSTYVRCVGPPQLTSVGTIDCASMPDAAPALAVACCWASAPTRLIGLSTLRGKESDRVATIAGELNRAGFDVHIVGDDLLIDPANPPSSPVTIQTWDDHRIAMAMAVMGLRRGGVSIEDPAVTAKSYPGFWDDLAGLYACRQSGDTDAR